jgi:hypothetical protein
MTEPPASLFNGNPATSTMTEKQVRITDDQRLERRVFGAVPRWGTDANIPTR